MPQPGYMLAAKPQLALAPRLQHAVRLLQMSSAEFEQEIRTVLARNPFLEEIDTSSDVADEEQGDAYAGEDVTMEDGVDFDGAVGDADDREDHRFDERHVPDAAAQHTAGTLPADGGDFDAFASMQAPISLREHLRAQVCGRGLDEPQRLAIGLVIEMLDDDGYLRQDLDAAASGVADAPAPTALEAALADVQRLDPPGVGARDLPECLLLQLRSIDAAKPGRAEAIKIVERHLPKLAANDEAGLLAALACSEETLADAIALVRGLDPRPGERYTASRVDYVVPDVLVSWTRGKLVVALNPALRCNARLDDQCVALFRQSRTAGHPAMNQQLQEARWLLRNVEQRQQTILRVAQAVVERQRGFFAYGEVALRPLRLQEVADQLGLHESTVSRATGNKFLSTPRGTFEFRHFFSRTLATETGGQCSASAVRALIRELIDSEDRGAPMSDVVLARQLSRQGIRVARRTVTKYRTQMRLPAVEDRRREIAA